jgi:hypothetical protein
VEVNAVGLHVKVNYAQNIMTDLMYPTKQLTLSQTIQIKTINTLSKNLLVKKFNSSMISFLPALKTGLFPVPRSQSVPLNQLVNVFAD